MCQIKFPLSPVVTHCNSIPPTPNRSGLRIAQSMTPGWRVLRSTLKPFGERIKTISSSGTNRKYTRIYTHTKCADCAGLDAPLNCRDHEAVWRSPGEERWRRRGWCSSTGSPVDPDAESPPVSALRCNMSQGSYFSVCVCDKYTHTYHISKLLKVLHKNDGAMQNTRRKNWKKAERQKPTKNKLNKNTELIDPSKIRPKYNMYKY